MFGINWSRAFLLPVLICLCCCTHNNNELDQLLTENNDLAFSAMAISKGNIVYEKYFGLADREQAIPITEQTLFDSASIAKLVTGLAIGLLIEEQKVKLSDDIRQFVPDLHPFEQKITIGHLLYHSSGLRDWYDTGLIIGWDKKASVTGEDVREFLLRQKTLNFDPGTRFSYTNSGYFLLQEIFPYVTGMSYEQWVNRNVFEPLKMNQTQVLTDLSGLPDLLAKGYMDNHKVENRYAVPGSSSLITNTQDLGRLLANFGQGIVGNKAVFDRLMSEGSLDNGKTIPYGFGSYIHPSNNERALSLNGKIDGYNSSIFYFPDHDFGVVVLGNDLDFPSYQYAESIASYFIFEEQAQSEAIQIATDNKPAPKGLDIISEQAKDYTGSYRLNDTLYFEITQIDHELRIKGTSETWNEVIFVDKDELYIPAYGGSIRAQRDATGAISSLLYGNWQMEKLLPWNDANAEKVLGLYYSEELNTEFRLSREGNQFFAVNGGDQTIGLRPISENMFYGDEWMIIEFSEDFQEMEISSRRSFRNRFMRTEKSMSHLAQ